MRVDIREFGPFYVREVAAQMHYIGGVGDYDIWVRNNELQSDTAWDVALLPVDMTPPVLFDTYWSSSIIIQDNQNNRIESAKFLLGEEGLRTALAMIRCFAPHVTITHPHLAEYIE